MPLDSSACSKAGSTHSERGYHVINSENTGVISVGGCIFLLDTIILADVVDLAQDHCNSIANAVELQRPRTQSSTFQLMTMEFL